MALLVLQVPLDLMGLDAPWILVFQEALEGPEYIHTKMMIWLTGSVTGGETDQLPPGQIHNKINKIKNVPGPL